MEKEKFIIYETVLKEEGSFIYDLHNNQNFQKEKINLLLTECRELLGIYKDNGKSNKYATILTGMTSTLQHTLFLISCHFMPDDEFTIKNYERDLSSEIVSDYYIKFRVVLHDLIF